MGTGSSTVSGSGTIGVPQEESIKKLGTNNDGVKSFIMLTNGQNKQINIDVLANKRRWQNEKRATLISADAS